MHTTISTVISCTPTRWHFFPLAFYPGMGFPLHQLFCTQDVTIVLWAHGGRLGFLLSSHPTPKTLALKRSIMTYFDSMPMKPENRITVPQPQLTTRDVRILRQKNENYANVTCKFCVPFREFCATFALFFKPIFPP